jgi:hypothetical protein
MEALLLLRVHNEDGNEDGWMGTTRGSLCKLFDEVSHHNKDCPTMEPL